MGTQLRDGALSIMYMIKLSYATSGWSNSKISKVSEDFELLIYEAHVTRSNRTLEVYMETSGEDLIGYLSAAIMVFRNEIQRQVRDADGYPEEVKVSKVGSGSSIRATV